MKDSPFYFEIKDIMTQFVAAFNDIVIKRHDKHQQERSRVHVRYVYAPKQRVIHDLTNKARHITLPVVAVNISGITRSSDRVFNKLVGQQLSQQERHPSFPRTEHARESYHVPQPVPIDIEVNMSIMARYQTDIEQIISNFVPYNDPYIILSWKLPEEFYSREQEIRSEVLWGGSLNMDYPDNLSSNEPYRLSADTSFTIKTWLFKQAPETPVSTIYKITTNTTPSSDFDYNMPLFNESTEKSYISTFGPPLTSAPYVTYVTERGNGRTVLGYNFNSTTQVYVSGNNINSLSGVDVDIHGDRQIATHYPPFTGVPIEYDILSDNEMYVNIPDTVNDHHVDIIISNAGGYGTASGSQHHGETLEL